MNPTNSGPESSIVHAMTFSWNDQKRDEFARSLCGVWPWDLGKGDAITSGDDVTCPRCLEVTT